MKSLLFAALAVLSTLAAATTPPSPSSSAPAAAGVGSKGRVPAKNKPITHFVDPATNQTIQHFNCDVHHGKASDHFNSTVKKLFAGGKHQAGTRSPSLFARQTVGTPITIKTYFHVITTTALVGKYPATMMQQQLAAMNKAYNSMGITFVLVNTSYTTNNAWASAAVDDDNMDATQQALRVGTYADLNIYFHSSLSGGNLGTCSLPSQVWSDTPPAEYYSDGCNINANTAPGGTLTGYNLGMTAVHETGHWLGLLHTFEGNACTGDGDLVADTPYEAQSTSGCPTSPAKNTCPNRPGVDPIHNYMDYSSDACYSQFTPGQVARIANMWTTYRKGM